MFPLTPNSTLSVFLNFNPACILSRCHTPPYTFFSTRTLPRFLATVTHIIVIFIVIPTLSRLQNTRTRTGPVPPPTWLNILPSPSPRSPTSPPSQLHKRLEQGAFIKIRELPANTRAVAVEAPGTKPKSIACGRVAAFLGGRYLLGALGRIDGYPPEGADVVIE